MVVGTGERRGRLGSMGIVRYTAAVGARVLPSRASRAYVEGLAANHPHTAATLQRLVVDRWAAGSSPEPMRAGVRPL